MHSGAIEREPFVEAQLVEQPRFPLEQQAEAVALGRIVDVRVVALPVGEALDQLAVERVGDVVRADRRIVGELHARAHGSRCTTRFGVAFISRFHSLMYSRMNASSVAGAVMMPSASVFTRPGMPSPRCM